MRDSEKFHTKQAGVETVQIGPRIPVALHRDVKQYCLNNHLNFQEVVELALVQFLADKDLTPVVQLQLSEALEITYDDPRFDTLKVLMSRARSPFYGPRTPKILLQKLTEEYRRVAKAAVMCVEVKMEYEEARALLQAQEAIT